MRLLALTNDFTNDFTNECIQLNNSIISSVSRATEPAKLSDRVLQTLLVPVHSTDWQYSHMAVCNLLLANAVPP
jgi:hypothetical protein